MADELKDEERRVEIAMLKLLATRYPKEAKRFAERAELVQLSKNFEKARRFVLTNVNS